MALSVEKGRAEGGPGADRGQLWQPGEGQKVYRAAGDEKQIGSGHSKGGTGWGEREEEGESEGEKEESREGGGGGRKRGTKEEKNGWERRQELRNCFGS